MAWLRRFTSPVEACSHYTILLTFGHAYLCPYINYVERALQLSRSDNTEGFARSWPLAAVSAASNIFAYSLLGIAGGPHIPPRLRLEWGVRLDGSGPTYRRLLLCGIARRITWHNRNNASPRFGGWLVIEWRGRLLVAPRGLWA